MSEEEIEFVFPITPMEGLYIDLHEDYLAAKNAGFTPKQAFDLTLVVFQSRLDSVILTEDRDD